MGQWRNGAEARTRACTCSVVCTASTAHSTARYDASKPLAPARQATCPGPCKPAHYALTDLGNRRHDLLHDDVVTAGQAAPEELVGQIDGLAVQILHTSITHTMLPGSPFGNLNLTSGRPGSIARRPEQGFRAGALGLRVPSGMQHCWRPPRRLLLSIASAAWTTKVPASARADASRWPSG